MRFSILAMSALVLVTAASPIAIPGPKPGDETVDTTESPDGTECVGCVSLIHSCSEKSRGGRLLIENSIMVTIDTNTLVLVHVARNADYGRVALLTKCGNSM